MLRAYQLMVSPLVFVMPSCYLGKAPQNRNYHILKKKHRAEEEINSKCHEYHLLRGKPSADAYALQLDTPKLNLIQLILT